MKLGIPQLFDTFNSFLLDTGAYISLIKLGKLKNETSCYEDNQITLKDIDFNNLASINTICYVYLDVIIANESFNHCFNVVYDNFPIPFNGLIGKDFKKHHKCRIDYEHNLIHLNNY